MPELARTISPRNGSLSPPSAPNARKTWSCSPAKIVPPFHRNLPLLRRFSALCAF